METEALAVAGHVLDALNRVAADIGRNVAIETVPLAHNCTLFRVYSAASCEERPPRLRVGIVPDEYLVVVTMLLLAEVGRLRSGGVLILKEQDRPAVKRPVEKVALRSASWPWKQRRREYMANKQAARHSDPARERVA